MSYETLLGCLFLFIILFCSLLVAFLWERRDSQRSLESERESGDAMRDRFVSKIKRLRASVIEGQALVESLMFGMIPTPDRLDTHAGYKLAFDNGYVLSVVTCPSMTRPDHVEVALFDPSDQWAWPEQVKILHHDELLPTVSSVGRL